MKRLFSIAFIAILLLNVMGYYAVFLGMQFQNDVAMTRVLDAHSYNESQTITIKVPIAIPYMNNSEEFERVNGKFKHNGETYRLVKQRYANDTLTVICLKDTEDKIINQALSNYVKTFTDKTSDQDHSSKSTITFIKDYIPQTLFIKAISNGWEIEVIKHSFYGSLVPSFTVSVVHPPERA